jgi:hypothetical protein
MLIGASAESVVGWNTDNRQVRFQHHLATPDRGYHGPRLAVAPDGKKVIVGSADTRHGEISVLSLPGGELLARQIAYAMDYVIVSGDSKHVTFVRDTLAGIIDLRTGKSTGTDSLAPVHQQGFRSLACLPERTKMIGACLDGKLRFCPVDRLDVERELDLGSPQTSARQVLVTPDGRHLVLVMLSGTAWILRLPESWVGMDPK